MVVIVISGKAESGKTTAAKQLKEGLEYYGYRVAKLAYGDYVKFTAKQVYGWNGEKDERGRQLLQHWGTDVVRKKRPGFWVDRVVELCELIQDEFDFAIIDDARFPNEIECFRGKLSMITIRVERPDHENALTPEQREHPSETALDDYRFTHTITAHDMDELTRRTEMVLHNVLGV
jgi:molybdopterin-guanine dinucleotide biosynthesis protein